MENNLIRIILFSYKSKNLEDVVEAAIKNSSSKLCIDIIDKNPIDRRSIFKQYPSTSYTHIHWSTIDSPTIYKNNLIGGPQFDYFLIMSDDTILNPGWDIDLIKFVNNNEKIVVSGNQDIKLYGKNLFYLDKKYQNIDDFTLTNFINRNLIFFKSGAMKHFSYPTNVKYYGEEELLSISMFCGGIDIYAAPTKTYIDLHARSLENTFVQFSLQHNYNDFIDIIKQNATIKQQNRSITDFIEYHKIDVDNLHRLPFPKNDVLYPTELDLKFDKGERFFNGKAKV